MKVGAGVLDHAVAVGIVLRQQPDEDEEEEEENGDGKKRDDQDEEDDEGDGYSVRWLAGRNIIRSCPRSGMKR